MKMQALAFLTSAALAAAVGGLSPAQSKPVQVQAPAHVDAPRAGDPFPFATCPISGDKLGTKGPAIVKVYDGREIRFCCDACVAKFEKNPPKRLARLDDEIIKDQMPLYPLIGSVVSGKKLGEAGKPFDFVWCNRLVRLADATEKAEFLASPDKYFDILNQAAIEAQTKGYPFTTCVVHQDKALVTGGSRDVVIAGRLIRLCSDACVAEVMRNPATYIEQIDAARQAAPAAAPSTPPVSAPSHSGTNAP
ncbi:MAG: hypothetical protein U0572_04715 [Phycisphaerales bacterium]